MSKMKKIVALLCATVMVATTFFSHWYTEQAKAADDTTATEAEPVELDGFENLTISDFVGDSSRSQGQTLTAMSVPGGEYWGYAASGHTNFDKKLVSMRVTFQGGTYTNSIMFGGNATWVGFNMYPSTDGSQLIVGAGTWGSTITTSATPTLTAQTAGLTSFIGEEILLQMSFEYVNEVNGVADLQLGFYINGKLYNNEVFTIKNCNISASGARFAFYPQTSGQNMVIGEEVKFPVKPVELDGFDNLTLSDFAGDGWRNQGQTLTAMTVTGGEYWGYAATGETSFDKKLVSLYVTFQGGDYANSIQFAGNETWLGFNIHPNVDGTALVVDRTWGKSNSSGNEISTTAAANLPSMSATTAGVGNFIGEEILLQMSFEYVNEADGVADLKLGFYINGELYNNEVFTIAGCYTNARGARLAFYPSAAGTDMIVGKEVKFPAKPITLSGFDNLTLSDFAGDGWRNQGQTLTAMTVTGGEYWGYGATGETSFDKKLVSLYVTFQGGDYANSIQFAGNETWLGFNIHPNADGTALVVDRTWGKSNSSGNEISTTAAANLPSMSATTAGVGNFIGEEILLQMSFEYVNEADGVADLKLGFYINGELYNNEVFTIAGCYTNARGARLAFYPSAAGTDMIVGKEVVFPTTPDEPEEEDSLDNYEEVTIKDFVTDSGKVMAEKAYMCLNPTTGTFDGFTLANHTDFDGKVLSMNVKFKEGGATTRIDVAGTQKWKGLQVYPSSDGKTLKILSSSAYGMTDTNQSFDIPVENAKDVSNFIDTQFLLQITFKFGEVDSSTNKADLALGVWINGQSCEGTIFTGCNMGVFGNYMGLYRQGDESTIIVGSVDSEFPTDPGIQPSGRYEKVTYSQFGIADGEYTDVSGGLKDETSVAGHVLCGDIQLKITGAQYTQLVLGGTASNRWGGIRLLTNNAGYFNVMWYEKDAETSKDVSTYITQLTAEKAGVDFNGEEFNLMMSTEIVEHDGDGNADDIKLGIWFNGVLYNNSYIYIDNKGPALGNYFLVSSEQAFLNADPELSLMPNKEFDKVTFSDFGLESDVCNQTDGMVKATAKDYAVLDKVVFSGDFRLSDSGNYQIIYGGNTDWNGFRLFVNANGTAYMGWYHTNTETAKDETQAFVTVNPADVGLTSFTKETFNFKISTELVDYDEDGQMNDIKVAVWFNDVLYPIGGNNYSIISDWGGDLKNHFSLYQGTAGTNVLIRNDAEYQANPYYFEDISSYRQDAGYTYPTLEGYVFSGWYTDAAYTEYIEQDVTSGSAWAKFVEEDVLSVKPQVKLDENKNVPTDKTDLRFVTTVDCLEYRSISFYIEKEGGSGVKDAATMEANTESARLVYEKLYAVGSGSTVLTYKPTIFSWQSEYFKAFTVTEIPQNAYGTKWTVTPYWKTMDGTIVTGKVLTTCVDDYETPGTNTSTAVSIDFLGEDVMPITGFFGPYTVSDTSDPMLIPDYISDTYFKAIADMGVNLIVSSNDDYKTLPNSIKEQLELGGKYGIGIYVKDSTIKGMSETDMLEQIANYSSYEAFAGMHLVDEPGTSDYCAASNSGLVSDYSSTASILKKNNIMFYGNMFPILDVESNWWEGLLGSAGINDTDKTAYGKYVDEYYSTLNPTVLSYDYYPFSDTRKNDDGSYNLGLYFWNLAKIRDKAQSTGKPFWAFVQAGSQWNDAEGYFNSTTPYYPDEAQFNWSAHTALAFGAQGIQYFPLVQPKHFANAGESAGDKMWDFERNGLIGAAGNKTEWYFYAQKLNKHIAAIDNVLMNASSDKILALGSTAQSDTSGLTDVVTTTSYTNPVSNEVVFTNVTATGNALVGCFDYCGKTALYVVNYDFSNTGDVTFTFNGEKEITKIENAETTETTAGSLTLNMEAGEGILLVIE